ncbi:hypothetical protein N5C93_30830 [Pseudomonas nitroreducens]|uniref:hypothetical protein n=1 Tax=Pseudomonas nitroreducens TaxID=46680 RepID=UPI00244901C4|nr:hypothetical protein [Pseudomonas nitroreducens]MDG9858419.1 hypothetical protein [Pseudomonas nitroreducens]MDH1077235.1 hypothetical protein [Pseudomonas nitroreducens]
MYQAIASRPGIPTSNASLATASEVPQPEVVLLHQAIQLLWEVAQCEQNTVDPRWHAKLDELMGKIGASFPEVLAQQSEVENRQKGDWTANLTLAGVVQAAAWMLSTQDESPGLGKRCAEMLSAALQADALEERAHLAEAEGMVALTEIWTAIGRHPSMMPRKSGVLGMLRVIADTSGKEMTAALQDVIRERRRQQDEEGFTCAHDDRLSVAELARAAGCYAMGAADLIRTIRPFWPWDQASLKFKHQRQNLVMAAATSLAALERFDRLHNPLPVTDR